MSLVVVVGHLYKGDFSKGLVGPLSRRKYDFIVATYALPHLTDDRKRDLLNDLLKNLNVRIRTRDKNSNK